MKMEIIPLLIALSQLLLTLIETSLGEDCKAVSACSCQTSKYKLDFSALGNGENPRFRDIQDPKKSGTQYDYQPCIDMSSQCGDGTVRSVAVCQKEGGRSYVAGETPRYTFSGDAEIGNLKITYSTTTPNQRQSIVNLQCGDKGSQDSIISLGEDSQVYSFVLKSHLLCPPGSGGGGVEPGKSGLSTGSVLLIIFFVLLIVYFIVGAVFLKYRRGAEGAEIIPNIEFWKSLPGLIKDGTMFVFRGCKTDTTYSQI